VRGKKPLGHLRAREIRTEKWGEETFLINIKTGGSQGRRGERDKTVPCAGGQRGIRGEEIKKLVRRNIKRVGGKTKWTGVGKVSEGVKTNPVTSGGRSPKKVSSSCRTRGSQKRT